MALSTRRRLRELRSSGGAAETTNNADDGVHVSPRRRVGFNLAVAVAIVIVLAFFVSVLANENMRLDVFSKYFFSRPILTGLVGTILLTSISMVIGTIGGAFLAAISMSSNPLLQIFGKGNVAFIRSIPLLVQLVFWYNIGLLFPKIGLVVPFTDLGFSVTTNDLISGFTASIIGLSLHEAALMSEIIRGGLLSVPRGQSEAARALGLREFFILWRIRYPQAMRSIIPATGNQVINLVKATSMVAFIAGGDLMTAAQKIYSTNFAVIPLLLVATVWYLILSIVASAAQFFIERHYGRGF